MAELICKGRLKKHGKHGITVSSGALINMQGRPADPIAVRILEENGFEGTDHHSRLLTDDSLSSADLILVMEENQRKLIVEKYPEAGAKTRLLKSYMKGYQEIDSAIKDPHGMSIYYYRLCFSELYLSIEGMLKSL